MTIAFVQSAGSAGAGAADFTAAFGSNVTAGNFLVMGICAGGLVTAVADSLGQNWTEVASISQGNGGQLLFTSIWYFQNTGAGACTVTLTGGFANFQFIGGAEFSGVATSSSLDQAVSANDATGAGTAADSTNTPTTSQANELLIAVTGNNSTATNTFAQPSSPTKLWDSGGQSRILGFAYKIVSLAAPYKCALTLSASTNWQALIATFKAASGGGTVPTPYYYRGLVANKG